MNTRISRFLAVGGVGALLLAVGGVSAVRADEQNHDSWATQQNVRWDRQNMRHDRMDLRHDQAHLRNLEWQRENQRHHGRYGEAVVTSARIQHWSNDKRHDGNDLRRDHQDLRHDRNNR